MDKEYDLYLVLASMSISFLASFLAIAFASFIVWHKKNTSKLWLFGAAVNMGLGIWAMHFVGMLALHLDTPVAFEPVRTATSALIAVAASYGAFWALLSARYQTQLQRLLFGTMTLGSGVAAMHYLGMDAMQMFPKISYDTTLFFFSLLIAYSASFIGLKLFAKSAKRAHHVLFSKPNFTSALVIGLAVTGMHYTGMAAAQFDINSYCTVLDVGIEFGSLAIITVGSIVALLLFSIMLLSYEQHIEMKEHERHLLMLDKVTHEVEKRTAELQYQTNMNERLLETMDAIVVVLDKHAVIQQFNIAAQHVTGFKFDEVKGKNICDVLIPEDEREGVRKVFTSLVSGMFPNQHQNHWLTKQGDMVTIDWHNSAIVDEDGEVSHVIGTGLDVTQSIKDQAALKLSAVAFETQEAMVVTGPDGLILKVNNAFEEITGYSLKEVHGKSMSILKSDKHGREFYQTLWSEISEKGYWQGEIWNRRKNGDIYPEWLRITRVLGSNNEVVNYIGNFSDISQRKKIEQELEFLAFYDAVTQLPNRRLFSDRLKQSIEFNRYKQKHLAVLFIDLDNFKQINDTFGHVFGDQLLIAFSEVLKKLLAEDITISRFGGDEFVILFSDMSSELADAIEYCEEVAQAILDSLASGVDVGSQHVYVSTSIGITVSDCLQDDVQSLLMQADTAMYQAKDMGKNTFRFYSESIGESMSERFKMEAALRKDLKKSGLERNALYVVYQPQYDSAKKMIGAEALVRWNSEEFGQVSPIKFIGIAEESGLIDELGMLVVEQVLNDILRLDGLFTQSSLQHISINLSIKQLTNPSLADRLLAAFLQQGVEPDKVRFEFTESAFLDVALDPKQLFSEMSEMGFTFALDDFGTGFSSLSYLKDLPISELKIDKSFIDGIPTDESDTTICSATIGMAKKLGLEVVAEGVETQQQFDWLAKHDCDLMQGYLMSRPVPYLELVELIKDSK